MSPQQNEIIINAVTELSLKGDFANNTLAKKIVKENPHLFDANQVEQVRTKIRTLRGVKGKWSRKHAKQIETAKRDPTKSYEYIMAFSKKTEYQPLPDWKLPMNNDTERVLVLSDIHFPYHDIDAIHTAVKHGIERDITAIYLNGDIVDFYMISRWNKVPGSTPMVKEKELLQEFVLWLSELGVPIYYKLGNHEDRWRQWLINSIPEMYHDDHFSMEKYLGVDEYITDWIGNSQRALFGKLMVIHGHEFGGSFFNPVNPARGLFMRAKCSVLAGHNHQSSHHAENTANRHEIGCWSVGCLSTLEPEYRPMAFTKWNHGAAIVTVYNDGTFRVENFRISKNKIL
jgi:predicted phosphodiesterase